MIRKSASRGGARKGSAASSEQSLVLRTGASLRQGRRQQAFVPPEVQAALTRAGGLNRFGKPNYRLIWGWTPTEFIWNRYRRAYELRPRYLAKPERFYLEMWHPPETYGTPATWDYFWTQKIDGQKVALLGPFPTFGQYEQLSTVETVHDSNCQTPETLDCLCGGGSYMPMSLAAIDALVWLVEASRQISPWMRRARVQSEIDNPFPGYDSKAEAMVRDMQPAFDLQPTSYLGHKWNALTPGSTFGARMKGEST